MHRSNERGGTSVAWSAARRCGNGKRPHRSRAFSRAFTRGPVILVTLVLALLVPAGAQAAFVPKGLMAMAAKNPRRTLHVIVVGTPGTESREIKARMRDRRGRRFGKVRRQYTVIDAVAADVTGAQLLYLAKKPGIHSITPDGRVEDDYEGKDKQSGGDRKESPSDGKDSRSGGKDGASAHDSSSNGNDASSDRGGNSASDSAGDAKTSSPDNDTDREDAASEHKDPSDHKVGSSDRNDPESNGKESRPGGDHADRDDDKDSRPEGGKDSDRKDSGRKDSDRKDEESPPERRPSQHGSESNDDDEDEGAPDACDEISLLSPLQLWPFAVTVDELWGMRDGTGCSLSDSPVPAIAIIDSGVAQVADFEDRVVERRNFSSLPTSDPKGDEYGHGTLVAGVAAGGASTYPGAAPTAPIVSLRVVNGQGLSKLSDVLAAADWLFRNHRRKGIRVANFSIRSAHPNYGFFDPLNLAVERLWHSGIVVVASAGNDGPGRMLNAPANDPFVITVGALDVNKTVAAGDDFNAPWSSYGYTGEGFAKPELGAPGRYITGPVPESATLAAIFPARRVAPGYMWMSGTSFAVPVVAGAAAQILARHPDWSPDQVKGALMATAQATSAAPMSVGVGEIDAGAAAAIVDPPDGNAPLKRFLRPHPAGGYPIFDVAAWAKAAKEDPNWAQASWTSASWTSASWTSASWTSASWTSASWTDASWTSASWTSASWT
ncbi:MAG: S8 family serine peptidase, partial [Actinomycetota bacterium]|nr:S8 family serine peptidase [Actinomycetota bacterium]